MASLLKAITLGVKISNDIAKTWQWILIGLIIVMIFAFFWIVLMQWLARYMIWFSIIAILLGNTCGLYYSFNQYQNLTSSAKSSNTSVEIDQNGSMKNNFIASLASMSSEMPIESDKTLKYVRAESEILTFDLNEKLKDELNTYRNNPTTWMVLSIILGITLVIFSLLFFCLFNRISLAIAVIEEASK